MLVLRPDEVRFGDVVLGSVSRVAVDRFAVRTAEEWGDEGAHLVFADVTRVRVKVRVVQECSAGDLGELALGSMAELSFVGSMGTDAGEAAVRMDAVVESVQHQFGGSRSERVVTLVGVSGDGLSDPVRVD